MSVIIAELICLLLINHSVYTAKGSAVVLINNQQTKENVATTAQQTSTIQAATDVKVPGEKTADAATAVVEQTIEMKENPVNVSTISTASEEAGKPE